jgi:DNA-binding transcriptional ArsR family regulator
MNPTTLIATAAAIGDPIRLLLLYVLGTGPKTIGQLVGPARVTQSSVSYHVRRLREAGLVGVERRGRYAVVRRIERRWATIQAAFSAAD